MSHLCDLWRERLREAVTRRRRRAPRPTRVAMPSLSSTSHPPARGPASAATGIALPRLALASLLLLLALAPLRVEPSCFPALFNFGDSTSDTGGIHAAFPGSTPAEHLPYGQTYFGKAGVRYSDGRLLVDFIATALGLGFIDPYLQSVNSNFQHGANFATAGATVRDVLYLSPFTLTYQIKQFSEFHDNVQYQASANPSNGRLPGTSVFGNALYTIAMGGNDFTYGYTKGQSISQVQQYLPLVIDGITNAVKTLYNHGARHFIVWDIEPQGCLPYTLTLIPHSSGDLDGDGCLTDYNIASENFNTQLGTALSNLQGSLSGSDIHLLSTYDIKINLLHNLTQNGYTSYTRACCGVPSTYNYNLQVDCGSSGTVNGVQVTAVPCSDPSQYVIWDGVHNTDAANHYIANQIFSGNYFSPAFPKLTSGCGLSPI